MGAAKRRQQQAQAAPSCPYHASLATIGAPARIKALPVDERGFPVPWFVAWVNGKPDHRIIDGRKLGPAVNGRVCWICGQALGKTLAFTIGPMCSVNRVISEPPSHRECAEYAIRACPFLSRPTSHRREAGMPDYDEHGLRDAAGVGLKRNPGVTCLWIARDYKPFRAGAGVLFQLGEPIETVWYAEGRTATPEEVASALYRGLPALIEIAAKEGRPAEDALAAQVARAAQLLPMAA